MGQDGAPGEQRSDTCDAHQDGLAPVGSSIHCTIRVPGEGIEPSWVLRAGNSSHDYTDRPEGTEAIVWAKQWPGTRWARESGSRTRSTPR